jgi:putative IMPACT (imprinted ancient) family translation regulator
MKKTAGEMPQEIKSLKSLLLQSDIRSKESCLKTADQALKQMDLADRTIRFEHMQLPVAVGDNECRTAELYVFRNRGSRKSSGEAGITILVALDTQHIGRVETLVREAGGGVSLEFRLEQAGAAEAFKRNSAHLAEAVEAAGYRLTDMRFAELEKKTTVLNAGEVVRLDAGGAPGGVDVRI